MAWVAAAGRMPLSGECRSCCVNAAHQLCAEFGADARQHAAAKRIEHPEQQIGAKRQQREEYKRGDAAAGQHPVGYLQHIESAGQAQHADACGEHGDAAERRAASLQCGDDLVGRMREVGGRRACRHGQHIDALFVMTSARHDRGGAWRFLHIEQSERMRSWQFVPHAKLKVYRTADCRKFADSAEKQRQSAGERFSQATQKRRGMAERLPLCGPSAGSIEVFA